MTSARRLEDLLQSADLAIAQTMAPPSKPRSSSPKRDKRYSPPPESSSKRSHSSSVKAHTSIEDVDLLLEAMRATTRKSRRGAGDTTSEVVACPSPRSASPSSSKTGGKLDDLMDALNVWDPEEEDDTWEEYDDYGEGDAGGFASELKSKLPERIEAHEYIGDPIPSGAVAAGKLPATPPPPPEIMIFKDIPDDLSQSPTIPLKKQKKGKSTAPSSSKQHIYNLIPTHPCKSYIARNPRCNCRSRFVSPHSRRPYSNPWYLTNSSRNTAD